MCAVGSDVLVSFPGQGGQIIPDNFTIADGTCVDVTIGPSADLGSHFFYAYCVRAKRFAEAASAGELIVGP